MPDGYASTRWVSLAPGQSSARTLDAPVTVDAALDFARAAGTSDSSLLQRWELLATLASADLGAVRAIEPHLDAIGIFRDAGLAPLPTDALWGVFAAEGGAEPLLATDGPSGWSLTGTKPWCSLADRLDAALVTAVLPDASRQLFAVDLRHEGVVVDTGVWHARGLAEVPSGPVRFSAVPAQPVGEPGWYLERDGFAWGGIGVAACWFGGAVGIARSVFAALKEKALGQKALGEKQPGLLQLAHLGAIDELIESSRATLAEAASVIAQFHGERREASLLAKRVRGTVARSCEEIIVRAGHALGPAPLALDAVHAKRVADLQLYVRQHHAERDQASAGSQVLEAGDAPW